MANKVKHSFDGSFYVQFKINIKSSGHAWDFYTYLESEGFKPYDINRGYSQVYIDVNNKLYLPKQYENLNIKPVGNCLIYEDEFKTIYNILKHAKTRKSWIDEAIEEIDKILIAKGHKPSIEVNKTGSFVHIPTTKK